MGMHSVFSLSIIENMQPILRFFAAYILMVLLIFHCGTAQKAYLMTKNTNQADNLYKSHGGTIL